ADNSYYWRVRAIDMDGNAGVWNCYGVQPDPCRTDLLRTFTKTFDNVPPTTAPSIKNLHMRDNVNDDPVAADQDGKARTATRTKCQFSRRTRSRAPPAT